MERIERTVTTPDGRILAVQEAGDLAGLPVVVHYGTPMNRHLYDPHAADAARRGLRLISYDRPGYGGSTPQPGRIVADCAADVLAICESLGLPRIAVWGISGGGPHALATAALLPGLVVAAAALAGPAPCDADGLDWFDGMGQDNADGFRLRLTDPAAARAEAEAERKMVLTASAADLAEELSSLFSPVDAAVFTGQLADYVILSFRDALAPGIEGWWEDQYAEVSPWGFELASMSVPVLVAHGRQDQLVPFGHGQWLAAHIPGAQAWLREDDGHWTPYEYRIPEVHAWLSDRLMNVGLCESLAPVIPGEDRLRALTERNGNSLGALMSGIPDNADTLRPGRWVSIVGTCYGRRDRVIVRYVAEVHPDDRILE